MTSEIFVKATRLDRTTLHLQRIINIIAKSYWSPNHLDELTKSLHEILNIKGNERIKERILELIKDLLDETKSEFENL